MRSIKVALLFESLEVPDDMNLDQLEQAVKEEVERRFSRFRVQVLDHPNEEEAEPLFDLMEDRTLVADRIIIKPY